MAHYLQIILMVIAAFILIHYLVTDFMRDLKEHKRMKAEEQALAKAIEDGEIKL